LSLKRVPILKHAGAVVVSLTAPGLQGLSYLGRTAKRLWQDYFYLVEVQQENTLLQHRLEEYYQKGGALLGSPEGPGPSKGSPGPEKAGGPAHHRPRMIAF